MSDSIKEALIDLKNIKEDLKERVKKDVIAENHQRIEETVYKLLENEDSKEEENLDTIDSETPEQTKEVSVEVESEKEDMSDMIDGVSDLLKDFDFDIIDKIDVSIKGDEKEEETNIETKTDDTNMEQEEKYEKEEGMELTEEQTNELLKELESYLENDNDTYEPESGEYKEEDVIISDEITENDSNDEIELVDEETLELSEEEMIEALSEMEDLLDETSCEDTVEEGISYADQSKKVVGSKIGAQSREGKPERRSTMDESKYKKLKEDFDKLVKTTQKLMKEHADLKETASKIKTKLYEATVASYKTANVNRLLLENESLTKDEKNSILKEFTEVDTIEKAKTIYSKLNESFKTKKSEMIKETVEDKLNKTITSENSKLIERTALYENDEHKQYLNRFKSLIK